MFPERIETPRLRFDRFAESNVSITQFYSVAGASETIEEETTQLTWEPHEHLKESAAVLEQFTSGWENHEAATYALYPRDGQAGAGELAGNTGLHIDWDRQLGTLGIWLRKPFWGRGYSGERAGALLSLAFNRLGLEVVAVEHEPENTKSQRAIEQYVGRFGGRHEGYIRNSHRYANGDIRDVHRYSISKDEWKEAIEGDPVSVTFTETIDPDIDPA